GRSARARANTRAGPARPSRRRGRVRGACSCGTAFRPALAALGRLARAGVAEEEALQLRQAVEVQAAAVAARADGSRPVPQTHGADGQAGDALRRLLRGD